VWTLDCVSMCQTASGSIRRGPRLCGGTGVYEEVVLKKRRVSVPRRFQVPGPESHHKDSRTSDDRILARHGMQVAGLLQ
jgi:hypothetical protein